MARPGGDAGTRALVRCDCSGYDRDEQRGNEESESPAAVEETITVIGIRAGDEVPVTKTNLDREQIDTLNYGQDVPELLQYTPAINWYSDSGSAPTTPISACGVCSKPAST